MKKVLYYLFGAILFIIGTVSFLILNESHLLGRTLCHSEDNRQTRLL